MGFDRKRNITSSCLQYKKLNNNEPIKSLLDIKKKGIYQIFDETYNSSKEYPLPTNSKNSNIYCCKNIDLGVIENNKVDPNKSYTISFTHINNYNYEEFYNAYHKETYGIYPIGNPLNNDEKLLTGKENEILAKYTIFKIKLELFDSYWCSRPLEAMGPLDYIPGVNTTIGALSAGVSAVGNTPGLISAANTIGSTTVSAAQGVGQGLINTGTSAVTGTYDTVKKIGDGQIVDAGKTLANTASDVVYQGSVTAASPVIATVSEPKELINKYDTMGNRIPINPIRPFNSGGKKKRKSKRKTKSKQKKLKSKRKTRKH